MVPSSEAALAGLPIEPVLLCEVVHRLIALVDLNFASMSVR